MCINKSGVNHQAFPPDTRGLKPTVRPGPSAGEPLATPQGKEDTQNQTNETTLPSQGLRNRPVRNRQPPAWMKDYITKSTIFITCRKSPVLLFSRTKKIQLILHVPITETVERTPAQCVA